MGLNESLIRARFEDIRVSLERLEELRALSREEFLTHRDGLDLACYRLIVAMEAAVQICFHVSAQRLHRMPDEYAECFAILAEAGILPADWSERLQRMARFRNVLCTDMGMWTTGGYMMFSKIVWAIGESSWTPLADCSNGRFSS